MKIDKYTIWLSSLNSDIYCKQASLIVEPSKPTKPLRSWCEQSKKSEQRKRETRLFSICDKQLADSLTMGCELGHFKLCDSWAASCLGVGEPDNTNAWLYQSWTLQASHGCKPSDVQHKWELLKSRESECGAFLLTLDKRCVKSATAGE